MSQDDIIRRLHPTIQEAARDVLYLAFHGNGRRLVITQGVRTLDEQAAIWAVGRNALGEVTGKVRTWAPPGWSFHNYGLAFDVSPLDVHGKPHWPEDEALWLEIGEIGEGRGLEWGGRWPGKKKDRPHFQHRGSLTIEAVRLGERPRYDAGHQPQEEFPLP